MYTFLFVFKYIELLNIKIFIKTMYLKKILLL